MMETFLLMFFAAAAVAGALLMLVFHHPMRVALALAATMLSVAALYAMLGLHVVAVFQVLIYVGAVMVFMIYAIMLFEVRDRADVDRRSGFLLPAIVGLVILGGILLVVLLPGTPVPAGAPGPFGVQAFAHSFLADYWLFFELASVLLLAAVVAAVAVLRAYQEQDHG
ncbi:MAG: NADH-quinone oxidoreductase subunit J [Gammaproteobacteria bacterium]|nr:NADH-quinone oxidoreductase subunit J [Gammaproteobacteria bacterium]